ncbi:hypothetical protein SAMN02927900_04977 [Rhizobium mongolense subsp. loessense]|uniref:Uncharacterized protein n=1 Tax=Rhizobium mongolense subsp. loessense TaxID=158890 RepID=A0A1G4TD82_9HYPH|nr:hypothetical protein SAMN02927900_04977 [Rhizobium mongolense subsp. loessense]
MKLAARERRSGRSASLPRENRASPSIQASGAKAEKAAFRSPQARRGRKTADRACELCVRPGSHILSRPPAGGTEKPPTRNPSLPAAAGSCAWSRLERSPPLRDVCCAFPADAHIVADCRIFLLDLCTLRWIFAPPSHDAQVRMLLGPPGNLRRRLDHAGHQASPVFEMKMFIPAARGLVGNTNCQDEFDK